MILAELPHDEELRLQDLYSYDILDTQYEADFDELVELASQICKCPISLISLMDRNHQWFKAKTGLETTGTSRDVAFCSHTILQDSVMQVTDATQDERFHDNPLVTGDLNIRFYAGMPIVSPTGHKVGTLCLIDHKPKTLTDEEQRALKLLANQAAKLLEIRRTNKLLCECSEEVISLKSRSIRKLIEENEECKQAISFRLHEDIAQTIAASIFYLQAAESKNGEQAELVGKARQQLQKGLNDIRNLSYGIVPPGLHLLSAHSLMEEYLGKTKSTRKLSARLVPEKNPVNVSHEQLLFLLRLMGDWLQILDKHSDATNATFSFSRTDKLILEVSDDSTADIATREKIIRQHALFDKVACFHREMELVSEGNRKSLLRVSIPQTVNVTQEIKETKGQEKAKA